MGQAGAWREVLVAAAKGAVFVQVLVEIVFAQVVVKQSSTDREILALSKNVPSAGQT